MNKSHSMLEIKFMFYWLDSRKIQRFFIILFHNYVLAFGFNCWTDILALILFMDIHSSFIPVAPTAIAHTYMQRKEIHYVGSGKLSMLCECIYD